MNIAGIGCRQGCAAADIVAIVRQAATQAACQIDALAAPHFKQHEPGLHQAAKTLGLPLHFITESALTQAQPHCITRSETTLQATGHPSIAEAAAIAAANGALKLPRIHSSTATCAIASSSSSPSPPGRGPG